MPYISLFLRSLFLLFIFTNCWTNSIYGQDTLNEKPSENQVLSCQETKQRVNRMLALHYYFNTFSDELSQRTFHKIFNDLDPEKLFFTAYDLNNYKDLKMQIGKKIENADCVFLFDIQKIFIQRIKNRIDQVSNYLKKNIKLDQKEYINVSQKQWAVSQQEIEDRLKKRIKWQYLTFQKKDLTDEKIRNKILSSYQKMAKRYENMSSDRIYNNFLNSFALSLDPHSAHMLPADHDSFTIHMSNKLEGIGAQLVEKDGNIFIKSLIPGGVAQKDGRLKEKDKLLAVDSGKGAGFQDVFNMDVDQVVEFVRGEKGTKVKLLVLRKDGNTENQITIELVRDEIELKESNVQSDIYSYKGEKIGVIKIPTFYTDFKCKNSIFMNCRGVAYDAEEQLKKLVKLGAQAILIDLRNDGGGDFPESIKLSSLFIPRGAIVQTSDKDKEVSKIEFARGGWVYTGPLIVLINRFSASASEIFAGAIQDYGRGIIVGDDHSYGKATVQIVEEIFGADKRKTYGAVKVTQSKFYRPGGSSNQKVGVQADIVVPSLLVAYGIGEDQLEYVLPRDSIAAANNFKPLNDLTNLISKIKKQSSQRLSKEVSYIELNNKIEKIKNNRNKLVLLSVENLKFLEEQENAQAQLSPLEDQNSFSDGIIRKDDLQLMESLAIADDVIQLNQNHTSWISSK